MWSQGGMGVYLMQANLDPMIPQLDNGKRSRTAFMLARFCERTRSER